MIRPIAIHSQELKDLWRPFEEKSCNVKGRLVAARYRSGHQNDNCLRLADYRRRCHRMSTRRHHNWKGTISIVIIWCLPMSAGQLLQRWSSCFLDATIHKSFNNMTESLGKSITVVDVDPVTFNKYYMNCVMRVPVRPWSWTLSETHPLIKRRTQSHFYVIVFTQYPRSPRIRLMVSWKQHMAVDMVPCDTSV